MKSKSIGIIIENAETAIPCSVIKDLASNTDDRINPTTKKKKEIALCLKEPYSFEYKKINKRNNEIQKKIEFDKTIKG